MQSASEIIRERERAKKNKKKKKSRTKTKRARKLCKRELFDIALCSETFFFLLRVFPFCICFEFCISFAVCRCVQCAFDLSSTFLLLVAELLLPRRIFSIVGFHSIRYFGVFCALLSALASTDTGFFFHSHRHRPPTIASLRLAAADFLC